MYDERLKLIGEAPRKWNPCSFLLGAKAANCHRVTLQIRQSTEMMPIRCLLSTGMSSFLHVTGDR